MFIGRKAELQFLEERYASREAELIVLYGRRRVGKTELLNEFMGFRRRVTSRVSKTGRVRLAASSMYPRRGRRF